MAVARRHTGPSLVPDGLGGAMRRQLRRLAGLGILVGVVIAAVAMLTWTAGDPSLSHATNAPVKNWIGKPGAILADLLMQLFGLAKPRDIDDVAERQISIRLNTNAMLTRL